MNLDKNNFNEIYYDKIVTQIKECDIIAFDLEYSGIKLSDQTSYSLFDTIEHRYQHIKSCAQSFTAFQLGIVLFTRRVNEKTILLNNCSKFSSVTYNINLFPPGFDLFDSSFICSAAAMKFLRNHGMNVNDIIDNGVGFLNNDEYQQLKTKLDSYSNVHGILTEDQAKFLENQRKIISDWLNQIKSDDKSEIIFQMSVPCLDGLSTYFQHMFLRSHFTEISTTTNSKDKKILIQKVNSSQRFEMDQKEDELHPSSEKYQFCMDMMGVSKIWKLISRLKKPIVGHNCLFDLITIYQKFFAPLPDTFEEFRYELNKFLPTIYDTKFIFGRMRMSFKELTEIEGGLESVFTHLQRLNLNNKDLDVNIEEEHYGSSNNDENRVRQAHEAGYDAYMTGCCLIYLANLLYKSQFTAQSEQNNVKRDPSEIGIYEKQSKKAGTISVASFETYEKAINHWKNYVNVIRAHEFCVCFSRIAADDGFRTNGGNRLMNTRPPWLIIYDRNPTSELLPNNDDVINDENALIEDDTSSTLESSTGDSCFSQAFLEQLLFEFGDANVKKFGKVVDDEKYQKFLVALPSYNITKSFIKAIKKRWPRLIVREYNRFKDDALSKTVLLGLTTISSAISVWSMISLIKEFKNV